MLAGLIIFIREEEGAVATEYALLAFFIAVVIMVSVALLGSNVNGLYQKAVDGFASS